MYTSISLIFAFSSLLGNVMAAPAALPPDVRDIVPSQSVSSSTAPTTPNIDMATVTPIAAQKRQANGDINILEDLVIPQKISSSSSSTSGLPSSTFEFVIARPTKLAAQPAQLAERDAQKAAKNDDTTFGALAALSFPQKISSSASATLTATNELSPTRLPAVGA
ncbi:MAG: hypothetical protein Q9166_000052 [cf. Caloplaca sp. 2 TL-2023]